MKKSIRTSTFACFLFTLWALLCFASTAMAGDNFYYASEVTHHESDKAYEGYTVFTPLNTLQDYYKTYLIDMQGEVIHSWDMPVGYAINPYANLLDNGNLLRLAGPNYGMNGLPGAGQIGIDTNGSYIQEVDWDGKVVHEVRHPWHKDITAEEFQAVSGLTDEEMQDPTTVATTMATLAMYPVTQPQIVNKFNYAEHHDVKRIWNSKLGKYTVLIIATDNIPEEDITECGVNPDTPKKTTYPSAVATDCIAEIDIETGELIWQWSFKDHMIQNYDAGARYYAQDIADQYYDGDVEEAFYRRVDVNAHTNQGTYAPHADWMHVNAVDYNPERDEIIISARQWSEIFVIDHNTTTEEAAGPAGDFLWRFGSPSNYASSSQLGEDAKAVFPTLESAMYTQLWGQHNVHWLKTDVPDSEDGEHILLFNNGAGRVGDVGSDALEINPYDENGNYVRELDAGYGSIYFPSGQTSIASIANAGFAGRAFRNTSALIVWGFNAGGSNFYSMNVSGVQRLPNGNTLICSGSQGHIFEVTPDNYIVWEYINPMMPTYLTDTIGVTPTGSEVGGRNFTIGTVFRAYRHAADSSALKKRNLLGSGTVVEEEVYTGFGFGGGIGGSSGGSSSGGGAAGHGY